MNNSNLSKVEKLKEQRKKLDVQIQLMESRAKETERKKDTRRKILVGSYYLDQAMQNNQMGALKEIMNNYLTRNSDRKLFDLPGLLGEEAVLKKNE